MIWFYGLILLVRYYIMTDDVSKTIVIVGMMLIFVIDSVGDKIIKAIREKNSEEKNK